MIEFTVTKKDLELTWFHGSGSGGQHRNKHANCCRIRHPETGVIAVGQTEKSRIANKRIALNGLVTHWRFQAFLSMKLDEVESGQALLEKCADIVDGLMAPENIVECKSDKDWRLQTRGKKKEIIDGCEVWTPKS